MNQVGRDKKPHDGKGGNQEQRPLLDLPPLLVDGAILGHDAPGQLDAPSCRNLIVILPRPMRISGAGWMPMSREIASAASRYLNPNLGRFILEPRMPVPQGLRQMGPAARSSSAS